jgi:predicted transcriptional regulator
MQLAQIARLHLHGYSQMEIAEQLHLSQSQISRDMKVLHDRWVAESERTTAEIKAKELASLSNLEREYWDAWRESRGEVQETLTELQTGLVGEKKKVASRKRKGAGNPDFLQGIERVIRQRCELRGMVGPGGKVNMEIGRVDYLKLSDRQLERILAGEPDVKVALDGSGSDAGATS